MKETKTGPPIGAAASVTTIQSGKVKRPFNAILIGVPGIGKSTWAASASNPIFIGAEENEELEIDRYPFPVSFDDVTKQLNHLIANPRKYKTVVIDTIDSIEKLAHAKILALDPKKTGSMVLAFGGYAKAYDKAETEMIGLRAQLKALRDRCKMNVIILAHSKKGRATDTVLGLEYDTYEMQLHAKAQAVFVDWVSAVLFANHVAAPKEGVNSDRVFAMGHGQRIVYTEKRPGFLAKNRYNLPYSMNLEFGEFFDGYNAFYDESEPDPKRVLDMIAGLMQNVSDPELIAAVSKSVDANKDNITMLKRILARVQERVGTVTKGDEHGDEKESESQAES